MTASKVANVQGEQADLKSWRWTVFLEEANRECEGSIISSMNILTAARCVFGVNASHITVHTSAMWKEEDRQNLSVSEVTIHPDYNHSASTWLNNIAILQLAVKLNLNDSAVRSIRLPPADSSELSADGWPASETKVVLRQRMPAFTHV